MKRLTIGIVIAGFTFIVSVAVTSLWIIRYRSEQADAPIARLPTAQSSTFRDGDLNIKRDGWPVLDVSGFRVAQPRSKMKVATYPVDVYHTSYKTEYVHVPKVRYDGVVDPVRKWSVHNLSRYDIAGRAFCYRMLVWDVPVDGESGVGVVYYITYYDLDGDGVFESQDMKDSLSRPLRMPQRVEK